MHDYIFLFVFYQLGLFYAKLSKVKPPATEHISFVGQQKGMSISESHLLNLLIDVNFLGIETDQTHVVFDHFVHSKLANICSTPGVNFAFLVDNCIVVATSLYILCSLYLHSFWCFKANIVTMAKASTASIPPSVDRTSTHETQAMLKSKRN